ncbi:hypothetical protein GOV13_01320 [Candidatus Pacearchaeota archaeon]|nr:hypothetical protein [Candidatus Pacearchaeota archaeon]
MEDKFLIVSISSVVAMMVFGGIMFLLNGVVKYIELLVFFIGYWVAFLITVRFVSKGGWDDKK